MLEVVCALAVLALAAWVVARVLRGFVRWWVVLLVVAAVLALAVWGAEVKTFMDGFAGPGSSACCGSEGNDG